MTVDVESLLREAHIEYSSEAARMIRQVSESERAYSAYGDEPLTSTTDTLGAWMSRY